MRRRESDGELPSTAIAEGAAGSAAETKRDQTAHADHNDLLDVVLLHGHPLDRSMWQPQVSALGASCRILAVDLPGYGGRRPVRELTSFAGFATDVLEQVAAQGVERFVLVGHSMGGQVALEICRAAGPQVAALVLVGSSAEPDSAAVQAARQRAAAAIERGGVSAYADELLPLMLAEATVREQPRVATAVLGMMRRADPAGCATALRLRAARADYRPTLASYTGPVLILWGTHDHFILPATVRAMQRLAPDARVVEVPGAGHMPNLENPLLVNELLREFLGRVRTTQHTVR